MPATEFAVVDQAYAKVREAYSAQSSAVAEAELAAQAVVDAQVRLETANAVSGPLHDAYLAAVQELNAAVLALTNL